MRFLIRFSNQVIANETKRGNAAAVRTVRARINLGSKDREELIGEYIIKHGATVRGAASYFGISKSTVHKDVSVRLRDTNYELYRSVKAVLDKNKAERHIRGGEATKRKYMIKRTLNGRHDCAGA